MRGLSAVNLSISSKVFGLISNFLIYCRDGAQVVFYWQFILDVEKRNADENCGVGYPHLLLISLRSLNG